MRVSSIIMWLQLLSTTTLLRPFGFATDPDAPNPLQIRRLRRNAHSPGTSKATKDPRHLQQDSDIVSDVPTEAPITRYPTYDPTNTYTFFGDTFAPTAKPTIEPLFDPITRCQKNLDDAPEGSTCLNSTRGPPGSYLTMEPAGFCCDVLGIICARVTDGFRTSWRPYYNDFREARRYEFIKGRSDDVIVEFDPIGDGNGNCTAWLDGQMCSSCTAAVYIIETDFPQISNDDYYAVPTGIDCENVREGSSYSHCGGKFSDSPFSVFGGRQIQYCSRGLRVTAPSTNVALDTCNKQIDRNCECKNGKDALPPGSQLGLSSSASSICSNPSCIYCNYEGTVCGTRIYGSTYDETGGEASEFVRFEYVKGRNETIMFEEDSSECRVSIDGRQCNSCSRKTRYPVDCIYMVDCENLVPGSGIQRIFKKDKEPFDGVFMPSSNSGEFETCLDARRTARGACQYESSYHRECSCAPVEGSDDYVMTCVEECECFENFCGYPFFQAFFTAYGIIRSTASGFEYLGDQHEKAIVKRTLDSETGERTCTASIDDTECQSCRIWEYCASIRYGCGKALAPTVECSNIPGGGFFDLPSFNYIESGGLFSYVSWDKSVGGCVDVPTTPPSHWPTFETTFEPMSMSMSMSYDNLF